MAGPVEVSRTRSSLTGLSAALLCVGALLLAVPAAEGRIAIGAYVRGADTHPGKLTRWADRVGRKPAIASIYKDWGNRVFEDDQLQALWDQGGVPMVTWEPWGASLRAIAHGRYDRYVRSAARGAARWDHPVFLRFAHEMNGDWYPWGKGTSPHVYKAAWRHLVRLFRHAGATNVRWVWTPYVDPGWRLPFGSRYPGDRWVDWVGLDGINWGSTSFGWHSFKELFGRSYRVLRRLSSAPMILAEVGCGERGGSKSHWVAKAMRRQLPRMHRVHALVWWSADDPRADLRVNSSRSALAALRRSAKKPPYSVGRDAILRLPRAFRLEP
jgi:mannan endo-1,4-beta-mannosidase